MAIDPIEDADEALKKLLAAMSVQAETYYPIDSETVSFIPSCPRCGTFLDSPKTTRVQGLDVYTCPNCSETILTSLALVSDINQSAPFSPSDFEGIE